MDSDNRRERQRPESESLGIPPAACLVAYFVGAAVGHLRVGDIKHLTMPLAPLALSVIVLVLRVLTA